MLALVLVANGRHDITYVFHMAGERFTGSELVDALTKHGGTYDLASAQDMSMLKRPIIKEGPGEPAAWRAQMLPSVTS